MSDMRGEKVQARAYKLYCGGCFDRGRTIAEDPPWSSDPDLPLESVAGDAVTIYNGMSLCRVCLATELKIRATVTEEAERRREELDQRRTTLTPADEGYEQPASTESR